MCVHSAQELREQVQANCHFDALVIDALFIEALDYDPARIALLVASQLSSAPQILAFILRPDVASDPLDSQAAFCVEIHAMFDNRPALVVQLGASTHLQSGSNKDTDGKSSESQRITHGEEIAEYVSRLASRTATQPTSSLPDEARRLVALMFGTHQGRYAGPSFSRAARSILISLAGSGAATARALSEATNYAENTIAKAAREIALQFDDPAKRSVPRSNWTFAVCDELAKRYRPWLQSLAAREAGRTIVPIPGLSSFSSLTHNQAMATATS